MKMRAFTRGQRIIRRIPLRAGLLLVRPIGLLSHRVYMRLLLPQLRAAGMKLRGTPRYIAPTVFMDDFDKISLGDRVVISSHVSLLTHDYSITTVLIAANDLNGGDVAAVKPIEVGNNVFIGRAAVIMPGTRIGDNVIIGAGAVVRGTVEGNSVLIGNPAIKVGSLDDLHRKYASGASSIDLRQDVS